MIILYFHFVLFLFAVYCDLLSKHLCRAVRNRRSGTELFNRLSFCIGQPLSVFIWQQVSIRQQEVYKAQFRMSKSIGAIQFMPCQQRGLKGLVPHIVCSKHHSRLRQKRSEIGNDSLGFPHF